MFDVKKLLSDYKAAIRVRQDGDDVFIALPFFHPNSDESIAIKISELPDGRPIFSDCRTTIDYLETKYVNPKQYETRLNAIMELFGVTLKDDVFYMELPTDTPLYVRDAISSFIEALSVIANIDV